MDYKLKYLKYKLKYLNLKKMYGGMNFNYLITVVNEEIFSNLYKKYLDSMTAQNFSEYNDNFETTISLNTLENFENNCSLRFFQSVLEHSLGIEKLNQLKKSIILEKRRLNNITDTTLSQDNCPAEQRDSIQFMHGERTGKENYDLRQEQLL